MVAVFIYNILLIVLYTIAMSFAINLYLKEKRKIFLILVIYIGFFILDNVIIYMTEFINTFALTYNQTFMSIPAIKTIIFMVNAFCSFWIVATILKENIPPLHYAILILMAVWMISVPMLSNSALKVWLYYLPNQLTLIYLGFYAWRQHKIKTELSERSLTYLKWIAILCAVSGLCILLEDTFVIFNVDQYSSLDLKIYNRNVCEDIFSIVACLLTIRFFLIDYTSPKETIIIEPQEDDTEIFKAFCREHQLTQREEEIFKLLLDHKQNQEIADELFLSIGTVKTHVHNIFIKLNVNKRNQIIDLYENFKNHYTQNLAENNS
ncbi:DNA-binding CsgD family transcriptional regulator [Enterococcus sp. PF1-24]|uniref:response regulator transcription factor n=1 Tax=unclassified Enterococcus TaxID=2608891 RepID=UPI002474EDD4|nr:MULTISPECIES: LuxR C-terminal-related transcriptional regulator [unclassified Enterococcus]MDH6365358.1 DNA-binding CsgD family transcriptional regulator [Enterococcus sp. PFB1-1]MDH6402459.1 DNA-binding CsgD family transcriptional regulator [Enterococcus sp. PF1-24]